MEPHHARASIALHCIAYISSPPPLLLLPLHFFLTDSCFCRLYYNQPIKINGPAPRRTLGPAARGGAQGGAEAAVQALARGSVVRAAAAAQGVPRRAEGVQGARPEAHRRPGAPAAPAGPVRVRRADAATALAPRCRGGAALRAVVRLPHAHGRAARRRPWRPHMRRRPRP
uniref:Uncharacterized protein n=1 Tax=Oryza brachyantha TaxID=4533 RepID=J3NFA3_ORYBR